MPTVYSPIGEKEIEHEEFAQVLSLLLPAQSIIPIVLPSLLDLFEKEEELDGQISCDSCHQIAKGRQKTTLDVLPPIIVAQLKRLPFGGTYRKMKAIMNYPFDNFDFYGRPQQDYRHLYDLIAISIEPLLLMRYISISFIHLFS